MENELSVVILAIVGMVLQLLFKYLPKLAPWYEAQSQKALIMLGAVLVVSLAYFGLGCTPFGDRFGILVTCTSEGAIELAAVFVKILISQQTTYLLTRKSD